MRCLDLKTTPTPPTMRVLLVAAAIVAARTSPLAGQTWDRAEAHEVAVEMAEDVSDLELSANLRFIQRDLQAIETFFGLEFEWPTTEATVQGQRRAHLEVIYLEHGPDALLEESARLDIERDRPGWQLWALEQIARNESPEVALDQARERDLLEAAFHPLLNGAGLRRLNLVLAWIAESEIGQERKMRLRVRTFQYGSHYEPYRFWRRADSLPEPHRTRVQTEALLSTSSTDTIPEKVLAAELPRILEVSESLGPDEFDSAKRYVAVACARRRLEACEELNLPTTVPSNAAGTDVVNLLGSGAFEQATNRLAELRRQAPPLVVARQMAQGLAQLGRNCSMRTCDLVRVDSLAAEWVDEILRVEGEALAGRIERTATWNGRSDLVELQRALAEFLSSRDLNATRSLFNRMEDEEAIGHVLIGLIQSAPRVDLVGAVDLYLDFAPEGAEPVSVHYSDLIRAGRPDLAERMIARASPTSATDARLDWAQRLSRAGRLREAQDAMRAMMAASSYRDPVGHGQLLISLQRLRMVDEYVAHVRALSTPLERLNGMVPLLAAWVRAEERKNRSHD